MRLSVLLLTTLFIFSACSVRSDEEISHNNNTTIDALQFPDWYDPEAIDTLSILSWNTEHFVDTYNDPYIDNDREDEPEGRMQERIAGLTAVIRQADADIVVLQEFESSSYARKLSEEYFPEMGYQVFGGMESDDWYMNVIIMSRIPLGTFYSYAVSNTPIPGQTGENGTTESQTFINNRMWSVDVLPNQDYDLNLTGVHLKAGRGERNKQWRIGMMALLRSQFRNFMHLDADQNLLIVGDLNSTPDSEEFQYLLGEGTDITFVDPLKGSGIFSHPADSVFWRIDHILPNTHLQPELVDGSVEVFTPFSPDSMAAIADHLPMRVKIIPQEKADS